MTKKLLSALLGGGALAIAGLAALPMLATGADSANPGAATTAADAAANNVGIVWPEDAPQITPAEELQADFSPASGQYIDLDQTVTVSFPESVTVEVNAAADAKPTFGTATDIASLESAPAAVEGQSNAWTLDLGSRIMNEGLYFLTLPAGLWTVDGQPSNEMTIYYNLEGRVEVVPNTESGIYGANYTYTDEDGNVFGYYLDFTYRNEYRYEYDEDGNQTGSKNVYIYDVRDGNLRGVKTAKSSIKLPGHIYATELPSGDRYTYGDAQEIGNRDYTMTSAEFRHDLLNEGVETSFPASGVADAEELKDVYVPGSVTSVRWTGKFDTSVTNFHFSTPECPALSFDEYANGKVFIYAPDDYYSDYKEQVKDKYNFTVFVRSESPAAPVYINVSEPGTLAAELSASGAVLEEVRYVIVTGTPDETDLRFFRRLPNLEILDLGQTTGLTTVAGLNGLEYLQTVVLPETGEITLIGQGAFNDCKSLRTVNIPYGVTEIGATAFANCEMLFDVTLPETLELIGSSAFYRCYSISNLTLPTSLRVIKGSAFDYSGIRKVDLSYVEDLSESGGFRYVDLDELVIGNSLRKIGDETFHYATGDGFKRITIPASLTEASGWCFSPSSKIEYIELAPDVDVERLSKSTFYNIQAPDTIKWNPLFPSNHSIFNPVNCIANSITYVPALTYNDYLLSDVWSYCKDIRPIEEDLEVVKVDRAFKLTSEKGIADKATLILTEADNNPTADYAQLTVKRKTDLNLGKFDINGYAVINEYWTETGYKYINGYIGATLIPQSTMTSDEVAVKIGMQKGRWQFLTFPFDVNVDDIEVEDEALWVVRKYSGEDRANLTGNTWQNMQAGETLKAGEGYIFHCSKESGDYACFTFRPAADGNALFNMDNVETALAEYPSEYLHNASWNLVGNTYPAYLTLRAVDFDAPVTVWNGNTYTAYSPIDDDYAFSPFQAFFVQRQDVEGGDHLTLDPRGRAHSEAEALAIEIEDEVEETPAEDEPAVAARAAKRAARAAEPRSIFNLTLSSEKGADRARLVVNPLASEAYEPNRDASKFMSSEAAVPQIFVVNNGQRMAIDERPLAEGIFTLGARFGHSGEYCISLDSRQAEGYVAMLTDNLTGVTVDITATPYAFVADAGASDDRFTLRLMPGIITGVEDVEAEGISISLEGDLLSISAPAEVEISVIAADGKVVAIDHSAAFSMSLDKGAYIVKAGDAVRKLIAE